MKKAHPFPTKQYVDAHGNIINAFKVTAPFAQSCPKHGGPFVRHGDGIAFYTGRVTAREKEMGFANPGDYVVTYNDSPYMDAVKRGLFDKTMKEFANETVASFSSQVENVVTEQKEAVIADTSYKPKRGK